MVLAPTHEMSDPEPSSQEPTAATVAPNLAEKVNDVVEMDSKKMLAIVPSQLEVIEDTNNKPTSKPSQLDEQGLSSEVHAAVPLSIKVEPVTDTTVALRSNECEYSNVSKAFLDASISANVQEDFQEDVKGDVKEDCSTPLSPKDDALMNTEILDDETEKQIKKDNDISVKYDIIKAFVKVCYPLHVRFSIYLIQILTYCSYFVSVF